MYELRVRLKTRLEKRTNYRYIFINIIYESMHKYQEIQAKYPDRYPLAKCWTNLNHRYSRTKPNFGSCSFPLSLPWESEFNDYHNLSTYVKFINTLVYGTSGVNLSRVQPELVCTLNMHYPYLKLTSYLVTQSQSNGTSLCNSYGYSYSYS